MTASGGHASRSELESAICKELDLQQVPHAHRSLHFRVHDSKGRTSKYSPAIVAHRGPILFLIEPVGPGARRTVDRLAAFLEEHSPEIVLVVVVPDGRVTKVPQETYDEIYAESDLGRMAKRIRTQDPEGLVRPFKKPTAIRPVEGKNSNPAVRS